MSYYCNNPEEHRREGRQDFERRGYYDHEQYNQPFDECSRHYTEGYDQARREEEYRQEMQAEERRREEYEQQQAYYARQRQQEQEAYEYHLHCEQMQQQELERQYWDSTLNEHIEREQIYNQKQV